MQYNTIQYNTIQYNTIQLGESDEVARNMESDSDIPLVRRFPCQLRNGMSRIILQMTESLSSKGLTLSNI